MDLLKELQGLKEYDVISDLNRETLPLVMWGAGSSAPEVNYYLRESGIMISDVFVDDEYYTQGLMFDGKPVLSYSVLKDKYDKVNIILGNSSYEKKELLEKRECINQVYCLFSVSYNVFDKTPLSEIEQHVSEFESVYELLEDDKSRNNLLAFLKTRIAGNNQYIMDVFEQEATFFRNEIFQIDENEIYLDVGAFDGDTIRLFLEENSGNYEYIYAVEPDDENYRRLEGYIKEKQLKNIEISKIGAWNAEEKLYFSSTEDQVSGVITEECAVSNMKISYIEAVPLDKMFVYSRQITLLKINYFEGVKEAIEGAAGILRKHAPKLVITVGFDCRNIRCIPALIKSINPKYKIYFRFNKGMASAFTLYGIIPE